MREFYGCYLLTSHSSKHKGRTYIGFTVNPRRRIRQHNGEITAGAWKTRKYRPWEMTLVLYGFATKTQALQFEWAWQNPTRSKVARAAAARLAKKDMAGLRGKIRLMLEMLQESPYRYMPLTLQFLSTAYAQHMAGCITRPPPHMQVLTAPMDMLPECINDEDEDDEADGGAREAMASGGERSADGGSGGGGGTSTASDSLVRPAFGKAAAAAELDDDGVIIISDDEDEDDEYGDVNEYDGAVSSGGCAGAAAAGNPGRGGARSNRGEAAAGPSSSQASGGHKRGAAAAATAGAKLDVSEKLNCAVCGVTIPNNILHCGGCAAHFHVHCLADCWLDNVRPPGGAGGASAPQPLPSAPARLEQLPERGPCPCCGAQLSWLELLQGMKTYSLWGAGKRRGGRRGGKRATPKKAAKGKAASGVGVGDDDAAAAAGAEGQPAAQAKPRKPRGKKAAAAASPLLADSFVEDASGGGAADASGAARKPRAKRASSGGGAGGGGRARAKGTALSLPSPIPEEQSPQQHDYFGSWLSGDGGAAAAAAGVPAGVGNALGDGANPQAKRRRSSSKKQPHVVSLLDSSPSASGASSSCCSDDDGQGDGAAVAAALPLAKRLAMRKGWVELPADFGCSPSAGSPASHAARKAAAAAAAPGGAQPATSQQHGGFDATWSPSSPSPGRSLPRQRISRSKQADGAATAADGDDALAGSPGTIDLCSPTPLPLAERLKQRKAAAVTATGVLGAGSGEPSSAARSKAKRTASAAEAAGGGDDDGGSSAPFGSQQAARTPSSGSGKRRRAGTGTGAASDVIVLD